MEGAVIFALILLGVGSLLLWLAVLGWRRRKDETISVAEAVIFKTTGTTPLPLTKFDRMFQRFQLVMMSIFGPAILLIGSYGLLSELDLL